MRFLLVVVAITISAGCSSVDRAKLSDESLVGSWRCGPVLMHGPGFDVSVSTETVNDADHRYTSTTTSVITAPGKKPVTAKDLSFGTWRLDGDIITTHVERVQFVSFSDPALSNELGQRMHDAQLRKKSTYQSRILAFDGRKSRSIPINSMYKEAVVESSCERL